MENTRENFEKFAALYWGQKVGRIKDVVKTFKIGIDLDPVDLAYLELRPLSDITDDEAQALGYDDAEDMSLDLASNSGLFFSDTADHLRSKGFLIGFHDLTPEQIISYGWVQLKTDK